MRKIYLFLSAIPFITACHSLSIKKPVESEVHFQNTVDHLYMQSQAKWHYIKGERASAKSLHYQAIKSFKEALIYHPQSFNLNFRLTEEYLQSGLYLQAFKQCNALLKKNPSNINLRLQKGRIYERNQLYGKALTEYDRILKNTPYHIKTLYKKALLHIKRGELSSARPLLTILSQVEESNLHKIYYLLAQIDKKKGKPKKALFYLKRSLYFQPDFMPSALEMFYLYRHQKREDKAVQILEDFHKNTGFYSRVSFVLLNFYIQKGNWDQAIKHLQILSKKYPENGLIQVQLAGMWGQKKDYEKAIAVIEKFLLTRPRVSSKIYTLYVSFLEQTKAFPKALDVLLKASRIFPENADILFYKGFVYDQLGQTEQAIKQMKKVLEINTNHINALNHLAFVYAELNKNLDTAEQMAIKALSLSPDDSSILDTAGWVLFKKGKTKQALKYLEQAYQNNTSEGLIAEHLAEVYYHLNMIDKSIVLYKKAIGLETDEYRRKKLEKKLLSIQLDV